MALSELARTNSYTEKIHNWYEEIYGDRIKSDFSQKSKVAVLADGDTWEMRIPLIRGSAVVEVKRGLPRSSENRIGTKPVGINACEFFDEDMATFER